MQLNLELQAPATLNSDQRSCSLPYPASLACGLCALGLALSDSPRGSSQLPGVIRAGPSQVRGRVAMATQVMGEALNALIRKWS